MKINVYLMGGLFMLCGATACHATSSVMNAGTLPPHRTDAQASQVALSLSDAVYLGVRLNPAIRSQYLDQLAEKFDLQVASDTFRPQWHLRGRYQQSRDPDGTGRLHGITPQASLLTQYGTQLNASWALQSGSHPEQGGTRSDGIDFSVIQPLLKGAGREVNTIPLRQARMTQQLNQLRLKAAVIQTIGQIIFAYHDLLQAQEQQKISEDALLRAREQIEINKALIQAGRIAEMDLLQSEAELATQQLHNEEAKQARDVSEKTLLRLLGLDLKTRVFASDSLSAEPARINASQASAVAEKQEPQFLAALVGGEQAALEVIAARDSERWSLSLEAGARHQRVRGSFSGDKWRREHYIGLELDIPLNTLPSRQQRQRADVAVRQHNIVINEARLDLEMRIQQARHDLDSQWRLYGIALRAVDFSKQNLALEREKFRAGRSSNFQVTGYEASLREAENARLSSLIGYLNALTALDMAMGTTLDTWGIKLNEYAF